MSYQWFGQNIDMLDISSFGINTKYSFPLRNFYFLHKQKYNLTHTVGNMAPGINGVEIFPPFFLHRFFVAKFGTPWISISIRLSQRRKTIMGVNLNLKIVRHTKLQHSEIYEFVQH